MDFRDLNESFMMRGFDPPGQLRGIIRQVSDWYAHLDRSVAVC